MRLPTLEKDSWTLESGEERHAQYPDSFWIPPANERAALKRGDGAKLLFKIESINQDGGTEIDCERMWVVVAESVGPYFIGRLTNHPALAEASPDFYLSMDVEIPFLPEHVIDIDRPPDAYLDALFAEAPRRTWPR